MAELAALLTYIKDNNLSANENPLALIGEAQMPKSIEYKGYLIACTADWWYVGIYAGSYTITEMASGRLVCEVKKAVFRSSPEAARDAAIVVGAQYIDRAPSRPI